MGIRYVVCNMRFEKSSKCCRPSLVEKKMNQRKQLKKKQVGISIKSELQTFSKAKEVYLETDGIHVIKINNGNENSDMHKLGDNFDDCSVGSYKVLGS